MSLNQKYTCVSGLSLGVCIDLLHSCKTFLIKQNRDPSRRRGGAGGPSGDGSRAPHRTGQEGAYISTGHTKYSGGAHHPSCREKALPRQNGA